MEIQRLTGPDVRYHFRYYTKLWTADNHFFDDATLKHWGDRPHSGRLLRASAGGLPVLVWVMYRSVPYRPVEWRVYIALPFPDGWRVRQYGDTFTRWGTASFRWTEDTPARAAVADVTEGRLWFCGRCGDLHANDNPGYGYTCDHDGVYSHPAPWDAAAWLAGGGA